MVTQMKQQHEVQTFSPEQIHLSNNNNNNNKNEKKIFKYQQTQHELCIRQICYCHLMHISCWFLFCILIVQSYAMDDNRARYQHFLLTFPRQNHAVFMLHALIKYSNLNYNSCCCHFYSSAADLVNLALAGFHGALNASLSFSLKVNLGLLM